MSRLAFPRPSTQVPPIRFSAAAEREDVAGDRSGAAMVLMRSSGSCRSNKSRRQNNSGPTSDRIANREVRHEVALLALDLGQAQDWNHRPQRVSKNNFRVT